MLSLSIGVQENHLKNIPDSKENNLEMKIDEVERHLQTELHQILEKMDKLTERVNKLEVELSV